MRGEVTKGRRASGGAGKVETSCDGGPDAPARETMTGTVTPWNRHRPLSDVVGVPDVCQRYVGGVTFAQPGSTPSLRGVLQKSVTPQVRAVRLSPPNLVRNQPRETDGCCGSTVVSHGEAETARPGGLGKGPRRADTAVGQWPRAVHLGGPRRRPHG